MNKAYKYTQNFHLNSEILQTPDIAIDWNNIYQSLSHVSINTPANAVSCFIHGKNSEDP